MASWALVFTHITLRQYFTRSLLLIPPLLLGLLPIPQLQVPLTPQQPFTPLTLQQPLTSLLPVSPSYSGLLNHQYSAEKEEWFQTQYEEGHDLFDPKYVSWLELHHPETVPTDRYLLSPAVNTGESPSLTDFFSHFTPCESVQLTSPVASSGWLFIFNSGTPPVASSGVCLPSPLLFLPPQTLFPN